MSSFGASTEELRAIVYVSVHNVSPPCSIGLSFAAAPHRHQRHKVMLRGSSKSRRLLFTFSISRQKMYRYITGLVYNILHYQIPPLSGYSIAMVSQQDWKFCLTVGQKLVAERTSIKVFRVSFSILFAEIACTSWRLLYIYPSYFQQNLCNS